MNLKLEFIIYCLGCLPKRLLKTIQSDNHVNNNNKTHNYDKLHLIFVYTYYILTHSTTQ